jgi:hypothetical protein
MRRVLAFKSEACSTPAPSDPNSLEPPQVFALISGFDPVGDGGNRSAAALGHRCY